MVAVDAPAITIPTVGIPGPAGPTGPRGAAGAQGAQGPPGPGGDGTLTDGSTLPVTAAGSTTARTLAARAAEEFNVRDFGAAGNGTTDDTAAVQAALNAAPKGATVFLPVGTYLVGSLSLFNRACVIRGSGDGSVLKAKSGIGGPALSFVGYQYPTNFNFTRAFGDFAVVGNGSANTAEGGIDLANCAATLFENVSVSGTGGPALKMTRAYLNTFVNVVLCQPVGSDTNDVPYLKMLACNGNSFYRLALRSMLVGQAEGVSGAVVLWDDGTFDTHDNSFHDTWVEFLHLQTNGTLFSVRGGLNVFSDTQFFDVSKINNTQTGTSYFKFLLPPDGVTTGGSGVNTQGGNVVRGVIPGRNTDPIYVDWGVILQQSGNAVTGTKGYNGFNVRLDSGVGQCSVDLEGSQSTTSNPGVVDNSGVTTNTIMDRPARTFQLGGARFSNPSGTGVTLNGTLTAGGLTTTGTVSGTALAGTTANITADLTAARVLAGSSAGVNGLPVNLANGTESGSTTGAGLAVNGSNVTSITSSTEQAAQGTRSIKVISNGNAGVDTSVSTFGGSVPASPGTRYYGLCSFRAATTGRTVTLQIYFRDSVGAILTATGATGTDTASGWTQVAVNAVAPANTATAALMLRWGNTTTDVLAASEAHYADKLYLSSTNPVGVWTAGGTPQTVLNGASVSQGSANSDHDFDANGTGSVRLAVRSTGGVLFGDGTGNFPASFSAAGVLTLGDATLRAGAGSPEGVVSAAPGSLYLETGGGLWSKSTGTGNTGWVSK